MLIQIIIIIIMFNGVDVRAFQERHEELQVRRGDETSNACASVIHAPLAATRRVSPIAFFWLIVDHPVGLDRDSRTVG